MEATIKSHAVPQAPKDLEVIVEELTRRNERLEELYHRINRSLLSIKDEPESIEKEPQSLSKGEQAPTTFLERIRTQLRIMDRTLTNLDKAASKLNSIA